MLALSPTCNDSHRRTALEPGRLENDRTAPVCLYLKGEELGQSEFAAKLDISVQHLSNVENGRKHVRIERAEAWAKALGYPEPMFIQLALQDQFQRAGLQGYELTVKKAS